MVVITKQRLPPSDGRVKGIRAGGSPIHPVRALATILLEIAERTRQVGSQMRFRGGPPREAYSLYVERRGRPSNEVWRSTWVHDDDALPVPAAV